MAVKGSKSTGVGKKTTPAKRIKPVKTKTIHFTSTNKYEQAYSPQSVSRQKNQITQVVNKLANRVVNKKRDQSKSVYAGATASISGTLSNKRARTRASISTIGRVPKNPGMGKVVNIKVKKKRTR
jgi:hypothetical protein